MTPDPGMYPGLTPTPGIKESQGEVATLLPLPIPPTVTDIDAAMAPTGKLVMYLINNKNPWDNFFKLYDVAYKGVAFRGLKSRR